MLKIEDNNIYLTRGDSAKFLLDITDADGLPYTLKSTDELIFSVRRIVGKGEVILYKKFTLPEFALQSVDTRDLSFGTYKYDIFLHNTATNKYDTFIADRLFVLTEEVHDFE